MMGPNVNEAVSGSVALSFFVFPILALLAYVGSRINPTGREAGAEECVSPHKHP